MANMKGSILGKLRGTVGGFTSRIVNGKNLICDLPASFTPSNKDEAIVRRQTFAITSKFTRAIYKAPLLPLIWESRRPAGQTAYNFIFQTNYRQVSGGKLTDLNTITPLFGFPVTISSVNLTAASFQVEIAPLGTTASFDTSLEVKTALVMIVFMNNPVDTQGNDFFLYTAEFPSQPLQLDASLSFTRQLKDEEPIYFSKYADHKAYFALVTLDSNDNPVKFSMTNVSN